MEDRFETLLSVMKDPTLDCVKLYLVDWGYNTLEQREEAKKLAPRIKLIGKCVLCCIINVLFNIVCMLYVSKFLYFCKVHPNCCVFEFCDISVRVFAPSCRASK